jgi:hypothetical protein
LKNIRINTEEFAAASRNSGEPNLVRIRLAYPILRGGKMPKVILSIFKIGDEYRAVIKKGENAEPASNGRVIYQDGEEVNALSDTMDLIRKMKEKAKKWAREQKIPFVHNIDFNPWE